MEHQTEKRKRKEQDKYFEPTNGLNFFTNV